MQLTVTTTKQINLDVTFPCYYEFGTSFILFKDEKNCLMISKSFLTEHVTLSEAETGRYIEMAMEKGKPISPRRFAEALLQAVEQFETYYSVSLRKTFAGITIHDPMIENTLYETENA